MKFADIRVTGRDDGLVQVEILGKDAERIVDFTIEPEGAETFGRGLIAKAEAVRRITKRAPNNNPSEEQA